VVADPTGTGSAADAAFSRPDDVILTTVTVPPAAASARVEATRTPFDFDSTAPG
jgi:hypothetical protein